MVRSILLVHPFLAVFSSAQARNLVVIFIVKLVVIGQFLPPADPPVCKDDDVPVCQLHSLCDTVGVTTMVDISGNTARHCGIHHSVIIKSEHVYSSVLRLVSLLSLM